MQVMFDSELLSQCIGIYSGKCHSAFGCNILSVVYGIRPAEKDDDLIAVAEEAMQGLSAGLRPGAFWVDFCSFLKHIPAWVPGAAFQRKAAEWKVNVIAMKEMPWRAGIVSPNDASVR